MERGRIATPFYFYRLPAAFLQFGPYKLAVWHIEKIGHLSDQMLFMCIDMTIGTTYFP